ncbi:MAG: hypothetical protein QOG84_598 [Sphingomonadales bacterium]|nr:hypothetical protein [Sphingomonadales bacterium]
MAGAQGNRSQEEALGTGADTNAQEAPPPPCGWSPSPSLRDREDEWGQALAGFRQALEAVAAIEKATAGCSVEEEEAWLPTHAAACDAMGAGLARAIAAPAPDLGALAAKLDLVFAHAVEPGAVDDGVVEALVADFRRLASVTN